MKNWFRRIKSALKVPKDLDFNEFIHECRSICISRMPRAERILSIGCAGTWYFDWFNEFYRYPISEHIGIDLNPKPDDLPASVIWIQHDGSDLSPINSRYVDMVFAGQFIEHISWKQQVKFLIEVNRVLEPNGVFVLDSPNYLVANRYGWEQPQHIHELSYAQICDLMRLAGFEISSSYGILPKSLLGDPPEIEGKFLKTGMHFGSYRQSGIGNAVNSNPQDSFIWWIVARKGTETFDKTKLWERLEKYYQRNESDKNHIVSHQIGKVVAKGKECFVQVSKSDGYGFALYGPYKVYPKGDYIVEFTIRLSTLGHGPDPDVDVCILDVATDAGDTILGKKEVKAGDLLDTHYAKLEFALSAPTSLEFRVLSLGVLPFSVNATPNVSKL